MVLRAIPTTTAENGIFFVRISISVIIDVRPEHLFGGSLMGGSFREFQRRFLSPWMIECAEQNMVG
jgi:hypothetical protein